MTISEDELRGKILSFLMKGEDADVVLKATDVFLLFQILYTMRNSLAEVAHAVIERDDRSKSLELIKKSVDGLNSVSDVGRSLEDKIISRLEEKYESK